MGADTKKFGSVFELEMTSLPQISIAVTMFSFNKILLSGLGGWETSSQYF